VMPINLRRMELSAFVELPSVASDQKGGVSAVLGPAF
jgi:hypothetical protein